jgi:DNA polymerase III gamma/tau subunit
VTLEAVTEMAGVVPETQVQAVLDAWMSKDAGKVEQGVTAFVREGYSATQLLSQVCFLAFNHYYKLNTRNANISCTTKS